MKRFCAFVLVASLAQASAAFAGEGLLVSGSRHVQAIAATEAAPAAVASASATTPAAPKAPAPVAAFQGQIGRAHV